MKDLFIQFLKENNAYDAFVKNHVTSIDIVMENFPLEPERWIKMAFVWIESPEGHEFWKRIDKDWQIKLYED